MGYETHTVNPNRAPVVSMASNIMCLTSNGLWQIDDDVAANGILKAGTKVAMTGLWGWMKGGQVGDTFNLEGTLKEHMRVCEVMAFFYACYAARVDLPRFYFLEAIRLDEDGVINFEWGT